MYQSNFNPHLIYRQNLILVIPETILTLTLALLFKGLKDQISLFRLINGPL
jgi:hypothetical protein